MAGVMLTKKLFGNFIKHSYSKRLSHHLTSAKYTQTLLNLPEVQISELDNGFRIATEQTDSPTCTVGVWIDSGSRYESKEINGAANFFEHLAFKGTKSKSVQELEKSIVNLGARFNSYTDREETAFYAGCLSSDCLKVVDILGDVLCNSALDENQIERVRKDILREIDNVDLKQVAFDYLHLTAYQGTPLEKSVLGSTSNVQHITKDDIAFYIRDNFIAPRMILTATGNVKHDDLVKAAEKNFGSVPQTYSGEIPFFQRCRFTGSDIRERNDWLPYAHVAIAVDTCGIEGDDIFPLLIGKQVVGNWNKTSITGGNTVNTLVNNIYKGKGCHSFQAFHKLYRGTGLWGCYFVTDGLSQDDFVYNLQNHWMKLCISITDSEIDIAKNMLRTELMLKRSDPFHICRNISQQILYRDEYKEPAEIDDIIENISTNEVKDICMKYIYDRCPAVAAVGPIENLTDYTRIRGNMYWIRY